MNGSDAFLPACRLCHRWRGSTRSSDLWTPLLGDALLPLCSLHTAIAVVKWTHTYPHVALSRISWLERCTPGQQHLTIQEIFSKMRGDACMAAINGRGTYHKPWNNLKLARSVDQENHR